MGQQIQLSLTWYEAQVGRVLPRSTLAGKHDCDVCVVGAGLAGLTAAVELASLGKRVVLLESGRVASGASGRNGGFVSNGFAESILNVAQRVGQQQARALYRLSQHGTDYVRQQIARHDPALKYGEGWVVARRVPDDGSLAKLRDELAEVYDDHLIYQSTDETRTQIRSSRYFQSLRSPHAFHINPLAYARMMAGVAEKSGVEIYENSAAQGVQKVKGQWQVSTASGVVQAEHVLFCVSALDRKIHPFTGRAIFPIATYITVSRPAVQTVIKTASALSDTRRAGDYYRLIGEDRIMWGGRITTNLSEPQRLGALLQADMAATYPQLKSLASDYAWGGLMGYTRAKMPLIGRDPSGLWYASAFGGHGLNTTAMAGLVMAQAIAHGDDQYRQFAGFAPHWAGGGLGRLAVQGSYWYMQLRDRLDERRSS